MRRLLCLMVLGASTAARADDDEDGGDVTTRTTEGETHLVASWVPLGGAAAVRSVGEKDAWLGVEGRATADGRWMARGGVGFDVLGASPLDVRLGLVLGGVGQAHQYGGAAIGSDVAVGATFDRLYGHVRWVQAIGPQGPGWLRETETLVGWRLAGDLRVFGAFYHRDESACCRVGGIGIGADLAF
jgi:hypothetical protein